MSPQILLASSIVVLLIAFVAWKRLVLSLRVQHARDLMKQLAEPYLNLVPLFFTIYENHIPKEHRHLKNKATTLLVLLLQADVEATIDLLHFLQEMDELIETLSKKRGLKDNVQFQLVEQDFTSKHQQLRSSIYALELHDYLQYVKVLYPA